jgi:hypothetical protein
LLLHLCGCKSYHIRKCYDSGCQKLKKKFAYRTRINSVLQKNKTKFRKRKTTKGVKHLPEVFEKTKREYLDRIDKVIKENNIPDQLVINWNQTGMFRKYFHLLYK